MTNGGFGPRLHWVKAFAVVGCQRLGTKARTASPNSITASA